MGEKGDDLIDFLPSFVILHNKPFGLLSIKRFLNGIPEVGQCGGRHRHHHNNSGTAAASTDPTRGNTIVVEPFSSVDEAVAFLYSCRNGYDALDLTANDHLFAKITQSQMDAFALQLTVCNTTTDMMLRLTRYSETSNDYVIYSPSYPNIQRIAGIKRAQNIVLAKQLVLIKLLHPLGDAIQVDMEALDINEGIIKEMLGHFIPTPLIETIFEFYLK